METYYTICTYILVGLIGLCVGSFLNVVVYRLPAGIKMTNDRSACPECGGDIKWFDNIPLLSYLFLGGRCRHCKCRISPRYPIVEALNMLLWLLCFYLYFDNPVYAGALCVCLSACICVFIIDLQHYIIYDRFNIIIAVMGIAAVFFDESTVFYSHLIGAAVGFASFFLIGKAVGKKLGVEALGMGDVKLSTAVGLFLGCEKFILFVLVASFSALIVILITKAVKHYGQEHEYPFGPFLTFGFAVSALFGNGILDAYFSLFNL